MPQKLKFASRRHALLLAVAGMVLGTPGCGVTPPGEEPQPAEIHLPGDWTPSERVARDPNDATGLLGGTERFQLQEPLSRSTPTLIYGPNGTCRRTAYCLCGHDFGCCHPPEQWCLHAGKACN